VRLIVGPVPQYGASAKVSIGDAVPVGNGFAVAPIAVAAEAQLAIPNRRSGDVPPVTRPVPVAMVHKSASVVEDRGDLRQAADVTALFPQGFLVDVKQVPMPWKEEVGSVSCVG
jgi:hypothetical protein